MEYLFAEKITTLPQMRNIQAIKGYRGLSRRIAGDVEGKNGPDALRAMADAMRSFALEHPGLSAATFRNAESASSDWQEAAAELFRIALQVFVQVGIEGEQAEQALRILRSLVRGFVISEMAASFSSTHRNISTPSTGGSTYLFAVFRRYCHRVSLAHTDYVPQKWNGARPGHR